MLQLILGGARSGKSRFAEQIARDSGDEVVYLATATAGDAEMALRIAHHRRQRPAHWALHEEPFYLANALQTHCATGRTVLVDCLTLWLTNVLFHEGTLFDKDIFDKDIVSQDDVTLWARERQQLLNLLPSLPGQILLVSNEIGQGVVPIGEANRRFVDELGWLHQDIAQMADKAWFVIAGLPQLLKDNSR